MSWILNINQVASPIQPVAAPARQAATARPVARTAERDTLEVSNVALARAFELSSLRIAKTASVRAQIDAGTFETPERLNGTVTHLLDILG